MPNQCFQSRVDPEDDGNQSDVEFVLDTANPAAPDRPSALVTLKPSHTAQQQRTQISSNPTELKNTLNATQVTIADASLSHHSQQPANPIDLNRTGMYENTPIYNVNLDTLNERPWRKPGADISDYFNYGFDEQSWRMYCLKQKQLRDEYAQNTGREYEKLKQEGTMLPEGYSNRPIVKPPFLPQQPTPVMSMMTGAGLGNMFAGIQRPPQPIQSSVAAALPSMPRGPAATVPVNIPTGPKSQASGAYSGFGNASGGGYVPVDRKRANEPDGGGTNDGRSSSRRRT